MSYEKTVWSAGDTITAEKLNNIENGIEAADKPTYSPEAITGEGDVSIVYNGNQIGVLSDSGTLTLDTEGRVVEHDIEVEYNKPAGITLPRFSYSLSGNNFGGDVTDLIGAFLESVQNEIRCTTGLFYSFEGYIVPVYGEHQAKPYTIGFKIPAESDNLNVIFNDSAVNYISGLGYEIYFETVNYPEQITLSISDKE